MNESEAVATLTVLGANWPPLRQLDETGIELWYRVALRHTAAAGNGSDTKVDALEVVERLVASMTYQPKPADWVRAEGELRNEKRRHAQLMNTALPPSTTDPDAQRATNKANIARLREMLETIPNEWPRMTRDERNEEQ